MKVEEQQTLVKKMKSAWPSIFADSDVDRIQMYMDTFSHLPFDPVCAVVNRLIYELRRYPSLSELAEAVRPIAFNKELHRADCPKCHNKGWCEIDAVGHGTYKKCDCGHPYQEDIRSKENARLNLNLDGQPVATPEEKREAITRGFIKDNPTCTPDELSAHLAKMGCVLETVSVGVSTSDDEDEYF